MNDSPITEQERYLLAKIALKAQDKTKQESFLIAVKDEDFNPICLLVVGKMAKEIEDALSEDELSET